MLQLLNSCITLTERALRPTQGSAALKDSLELHGNIALALPLEAGGDSQYCVFAASGFLPSI